MQTVPTDPSPFPSTSSVSSSSVIQPSATIFFSFHIWSSTPYIIFPFHSLLCYKQRDVPKQDWLPKSLDPVLCTFISRHIFSENTSYYMIWKSPLGPCLLDVCAFCDRQNLLHNINITTADVSMHQSYLWPSALLFVAPVWIHTVIHRYNFHCHPPPPQESTDVCCWLWWNFSIQPVHTPDRRHKQVRTQHVTKTFTSSSVILPYTRSFVAACTEPNNLQDQGRWSFCCGLSRLSPDGGFCCWSTSPHHSPPQSLTWTPSYSTLSSWTDYRHKREKTKSLTLQHVSEEAEKKIASKRNSTWKRDKSSKLKGFSFVWFIQALSLKTATEIILYPSLKLCVKQAHRRKKKEHQHRWTYCQTTSDKQTEIPKLH